jgi:hypothetical protein
MSPEQRYCEYCGAELVAGDGFCRSCGKAVALPAPASSPPLEAEESDSSASSTQEGRALPRWIAAAALGFVVAIAGASVAWLATDWNAPLLGRSPLGSSGIPSGAVAVVHQAPDGTITKDDFRAELNADAVRLGITNLSEMSDPQRSALRSYTMDDLIGQRWVSGEAQELGIVVSPAQVNSSLDQVLKQANIRGPAQLNRALAKWHMSRQELLAFAREQLLAKKLQSEFLRRDNGAFAQQAAQHRRVDLKWRARTDCRAGFTTSWCSHGPPFKTPPPATSTVSPGATPGP